jgi:hypothetical protein
MGILSRFYRTNNGSAAIETAIVLPLVIWLIMGIIEIGIVFHISSLANYAGNQSARMGKTGYMYGSQGTREDMVSDEALKYLGPWVYNKQDLSVTAQSYGDFADLGTDGTPGTGTGGNLVLYTITLKWKIFTPIFASMLGQDGVYPISARVLVKNEAF